MKKCCYNIFAYLFSGNKLKNDVELYSLEEQKKSHTIHMSYAPEKPNDNVLDNTYKWN